MARIRYNFLNSSLSSAVTSTDTTITVPGLASAPAVVAPDTMRITIESEIVDITAHTAGSVTATISRGQEGTTAVGHAAGSTVRQAVYASDFTDPTGFGMVLTTIPPSLGVTTASVGAANRTVYFRVINGGTISKIRCQVTVQSGNISAAAYRNSGVGTAGAPSTRLATSGAVACPAAGVADISLGASVTLAPGDWIAMSCDNNTAMFLSAGGVGTAPAIAAGVSAFEAIHPCPATASPTAAIIGPIVLLGIA